MVRLSLYYSPISVLLRHQSPAAVEIRKYKGIAWIILFHVTPCNIRRISIYVFSLFSTIYRRRGAIPVDIRTIPFTQSDSLTCS